MKKTWSIFNLFKKQITYLGDYFSASEISRLLEDEEFSVYVTEKGERSNGILISDSGKWLCIADRYYPLDLIAYFSEPADAVVYIDGRRIKVHYGEAGLLGRRCLKELYGPHAYREGKHTFFYVDKNYRTGEPSVWQYDHECVEAFETLGFESPFSEKYKDILFNLEYDYMQSTNAYCEWQKVYNKYKKDMKKLLSADWRQLRYDWESAMLKTEFRGYDPRKQLRNEIRNLQNGDNILTALNSMVLDDATLGTIIFGINKLEIRDIRCIFDIEAYTDPFYVCNCIRLLKMMGQPRNIVGIDFLFDCLNDIKEPYYDMAMELLLTFDEKMLVPVLESKFGAAIEDKDVLKIAGLMAFADKIHYRLVG
jgi:hypothetical protein